MNINEYCMMGDPSFRKHFRITKPVFEVSVLSCCGAVNKLFAFPVMMNVMNGILFKCNCLCTSFQILITEVGNHLIEKNRLQRERRPLPHLLLMVLWILSTPDSFRSVALRFGVYPSEVHNHYVTIIVALQEMGPRFIYWPEAAHRHEMQRRMERISGIPGICGIMDGRHVPLPAPSEDQVSYRNYHHGHSIKIQAVVDDLGLVRDVYIGEAGSLHDGRVFRRSPLCRNLFFDRPDMLGRGEHIIADSAYTLYDKVIYLVSGMFHSHHVCINYG